MVNNLYETTDFIDAISASESKDAISSSDFMSLAEEIETHINETLATIDYVDSLFEDEVDIDTVIGDDLTGLDLVEADTIRALVGFEWTEDLSGNPQSVLSMDPGDDRGWDINVSPDAIFIQSKDTGEQFIFRHDGTLANDNVLVRKNRAVLNDRDGSIAGDLTISDNLTVETDSTLEGTVSIPNETPTHPDATADGESATWGQIHPNVIKPPNMYSSPVDVAKEANLPTNAGWQEIIDISNHAQLNNDAILYLWHFSVRSGGGHNVKMGYRYTGESDWKWLAGRESNFSNEDNEQWASDAQGININVWLPSGDDDKIEFRLGGSNPSGSSVFLEAFGEQNIGIG